MPHIALVTESRYEDPPPKPGWYVQNILAEDALLAGALSPRGVSCERVDWARRDVDWARFDAAVIRTTWDYFHRFAEFSDWLDTVATRTRLINPLSLLRWNVDKHYLQDLQTAGVDIVPTRFVAPGDEAPLRAHVDAVGWPELVLKPAVSGGARHTYRFRREEAAAFETRFRSLVEHEAMLIQPFMQTIVDEGEVTIVGMQGEPTHALRKRAKAGDFRVQDDFGGSLHDHAPSSEEWAFARHAFAACDPVPVYGRVDYCRDAAGTLRVMELELVEPELWLRRHPPAAERFAEGIARTLLDL